MNDLSETQSATLPTLIDRAAASLTSAKNSAEVLEARDMARVAYDAAKSAGRMAKAKRAHEDVIAAVYRAQADALLIEARAKMRLADEYDAAQERGEVAGLGSNQHRKEGVADANTLGLRRDEIHEARALRDAESSDPGKTERVLSEIVARGEEPTKAKLRREVKTEEPEPEPAEEEPDHIVKLRREYRKLTPETQEDDWVSLRVSHDEMKDEISSWKRKFKGLQADYKEIAESRDLGPTVSNQVRQIASLTRARDAKQAELAKEVRRANFFEAELKKARASLEAQEIPL